jgi:hypothetical protein
MTHYLRISVTLLVPILAAGCAFGPPAVGEVEGTVTLKGKPLANVRVEFMPDYRKDTKGPRSTAMTDDKGHYTLTCDDGRPGAVVGTHLVLIRWDDSWYSRDKSPRNVGADFNSDAEAARQKSPVPAQYRAASTTPLQKEVKSGKQTIDLELTP